MSEGPFYEDSQLIQDKRIEGTFDDGKGDEVKWTVSRNKDSKRYTIQLTDGDSKPELTGALFRLGDTLFLDLFPLKESAAKRVPGGAPSTSEILRVIMAEKKHFVMKVEFTEDGVSFWYPAGNSVAFASMKAPELKVKVIGEMGVLIFPNSPKESQKYLLRFAKDAAVFSSKGHLIRKK